ncbi:MAG: motility associated factor glycosyltransferase family protein [Acidobacteria bacterium]|nr:motility associated factor glycosyltransferase family protein [Acidobacteriota bacterium]
MKARYSLLSHLLLKELSLSYSPQRDDRMSGLIVYGDRGILPASHASQIQAGFREFPLSYLEANLALLAVHQPGLAHQLKNIPTKKINISLSAVGIPTASYERGSSKFALHSRYDPLKEARQILKKTDYTGTDYFILLGFGLGYILDALLEEKGSRSNHYFIVESDLEIIRAVFEARDLKHILSLPYLHFAWPASGPELAEQWRSFFNPVQAEKSTFITHLPSVALNAGFFKAAVEMIQSQTFQTFTDINTLVVKSQEFLDNFVKNLPAAARAPGIAKFKDSLSGVPAVIVSAGPSLDKNIHELRDFEEHVLILSTDSALKPLLAAGIDPHFVLTGDPSPANYLHIKGAPSKKAFLVAEATSFPAVFGEFPGKILTCTFEGSSLHSLSDLLGSKGMLRAWGSVATMALDFALLLQCNPVIFIGQDLAHTDGRIYCSGLCFDEDWFSGVVDPDKWAERLEGLRSGKRTIVIDDIFGQPVESTDKLTAYWNWFAKTFRDHPEVQFINATEGGILRDNVSVMSLREALHRYCRNNLDIRTRIRETFDKAKEDSLFYAGINLSTLKGEVAGIQAALELGFRLCRMRSGYSPQELMKRLESAKESIYYNPHLAPVLDSLNQMGNFTFLRKRNQISRNSPDADLLENIGSTYSEYFSSVREALSKINKALSQIELKFKSRIEPSACSDSP